MRYLIYCANVPTPMICESMGEAINAACKLIRGGTDVRQIKGTDGFIMDRSDIEIECSRRIEVGITVKSTLSQEYARPSAKKS